MIYLHILCYAILVYLLWRADSKATVAIKINESLILKIEKNNEDFEELTYHNDLLKTEAKFVLDQHEEINEKFNFQLDMYTTLQDKFKLLEVSYKDRIQHFEEQIQTISSLHTAEIKNAVKKAREDSLKRSRSVLRGQATEHLAPYIMENVNPKDCRFMGNPVDYIVFDGLSDVTDKISNEIKEVKFIDIKTGNSSLNTAQRRIRDAIKDNRVSFEVVNPDKLKPVEKKDS